MKTGDFLLASDLYANAYRFYQVVKATAKTVTIRRVAANRDGVPVRDAFLEYERPMTKRVSDDGRVSLGTWACAKLWDGVPFHSEHPVWGTNYNLY